MRIILPKTLIDKTAIDQPLFFLAGPDQGGGKWQEECCALLDSTLPDFFAVVPVWKPSDYLKRFAMGGVVSTATQTDWEYDYLELAANLSIESKGCVIFWLPKEQENYVRVGDEPYATNTRGEIGRWPKYAAMTKGHIVVGAQKGFPGLRTIQRNLARDFGVREFPILDSLDRVVEEAVRWAAP